MRGRPGIAGVLGKLLVTAAIFGALLGLAPRVFAEESVVLWHSYRGAEQQALEKVIRRINGEQSRIRIEPVVNPHASYANKLTSSIPRGHGPDLFIFAHERIGGWVDSGLLMSLGSRVERAQLEQYLDEALAPLYLDGELYGLPLTFKSAALFFNTELIDAPPTTTDELIAIARGLTDHEARRYGLVYDMDSFYHHAGWVHGHGGALVSEDGTVRLDSPEVIASVAFLRDLVREHRICPDEADGATVTQLWNEGRAAMVINGPWFLGEISDDIQYGVTTLPVVSSTGLPARPFLTSEALMMSAETSNPDGALEAMLLLAGLESAITRAVEGRQAVANRAAWEDPRVAADPVLTAFRAQLDQTEPMSSGAQMRSVWEPAEVSLRRVLRGADEPGPAMATAQRHFEILTRPPPPAADSTPYFVVFALLALVACIYGVRRLRTDNVLGRARSSSHAYAYIAPTAVAVVLLVFVPFVVATSVSLFSHRQGEFTFVGLRNFLWILSARDYGVTDPMGFYFTLVVTVIWTALNVALHVTIGVALAMVMRNLFAPIRAVYRVLLIVPWAVPNYITALIWRGMFHRQFGAINDLLDWLGLERVAWFSDFWTALAANVCTNTWLGFPFMMVVTLGALQAIPQDLEEAAEVDGAGRWARFVHVTLPLLRPALLPAVVLGSVWTFNMFNIVYLVSGGEPGGSTEILISEAYRWAFSRQEQYGYASAYGVLVFMTLFFYSRILRKVTGEGKLS